MQNTYCLEFILSAYGTSCEVIQSSLTEFSEGLEVVKMLSDFQDKALDYKVSLRTQDPTVIFDICAQLGRIKSVKVSEEGR